MILARLLAAFALIPIFVVLGSIYVVFTGIGWIASGQNSFVRITYPEMK